MLIGKLNMLESFMSHAFLDKEMVNEAGPYHNLLSNIFDRVLLGDSKSVHAGHIVMHMLKEHKPEKCYKEYLHVWNNVLMVYQGGKDLNELQRKAKKNLENKIS